jgi:hypothetical protein
LLLTLLAVPVFYSFFEDIQESHVWRRVATPVSNAGHRLKEAVAGVFKRKKQDDIDGEEFIEHEPSK